MKTLLKRESKQAEVSPLGLWGGEEHFFAVQPFASQIRKIRKKIVLLVYSVYPPFNTCPESWISPSSFLAHPQEN